MTQITPLTLDDGTVIYIEVTGGIDNLPAEIPEAPEESTRTAKGASEQVMQRFQAMQNSIRAYTIYTLNAFKQMAGANVDKVTLEFGMKVAGEVGVPYITKGTTDANLKITVECSFPKDSKD